MSESAGLDESDSFRDDRDVLFGMVERGEPVLFTGDLNPTTRMIGEFGLVMIVNLHLLVRLCLRVSVSVSVSVASRCVHWTS